MAYAGELQQEKKTTELELMIQKFSDQLDRLVKNNQRLCSVGNRLVDESGTAKENSPQPPSPYMPGTLSSLNGYIEKFIDLNCAQETYLNKLENII
jgi:hypothetical protein